MKGWGDRCGHGNFLETPSGLTAALEFEPQSGMPKLSSEGCSHTDEVQGLSELSSGRLDS